MLGTNIDAVGWPSCGEIDIMELTGDLPNRVVGTVHYGSSVANHQYKGESYYLSNGKTSRMNSMYFPSSGGRQIK